MSRWLEQRTIWQFALIMWAVCLAAVTGGTLTAAAWLGLGHQGLSEHAVEAALGSIVLAMSATWGRYLRQKRSAR
jgi:hypothetical protein